MKKFNPKKKLRTIRRNKRKNLHEARRKIKRKNLRLQEERMEKSLKKARNSSPEETIVL